jgi:hypothetical protein
MRSSTDICCDDFLDLLTAPRSAVQLQPAEPPRNPDAGDVASIERLFDNGQVLVDPGYLDPAAFAAELAALDAAGVLVPSQHPEARPGDTFAPDWFDPCELDGGELARVTQVEWELSGADEQDEAEAALLAERAPAWISLPPGGDLATALEGVRCAAESPVEVMKACDREIAWLQAVKLDSMASFTKQRRGEAAATGWERGHDPVTKRPTDPERSAACEIAAALRLSPNTVSSHIQTAERMAGPLADTRSALRCGTIGFGHALAISDATMLLPADKQRWVQDRVLPKATRQTRAQLGASLRRAVAKADSRDHVRRHRDALAERECRTRTLDDGMAGIWLTHSADRIAAVWTAVHSLAESAKAADPVTGEADPRTAEQRRADAMTDVFAAILDRGTDWLDQPLPVQQRRRPHIEVLVPITTLLGLDDHPAELSGHGPIPAETARRIAAEGTWRRLLTDPATGAVLEAATTRHDPPAQVSETVLARDRTCRWLGCNRPARECDRDHGRRYADTGVTTLKDLRAFCEYHHLVKDDHRGGWSILNLPDGSTRITTPTGHVYVTTPPAVGPIASDADPPPDVDPDPPPF